MQNCTYLYKFTFKIQNIFYNFVFQILLIADPQSSNLRAIFIFGFMSDWGFIPCSEINFTYQIKN